jgi:hypothetical protein
MKNILKWGGIALGVLLIIFIITTFFGAQDATEEARQRGGVSGEQTVQSEQEATNTNKDEAIEVVFDIPSLLSKDILYFVSTYGEAVNDNPEPTELALQTGVETWTKRFEKSGYAIAVTYKIETDMVTEIFLSKGTYDMPLEDTWITKNDTPRLLAAGNLSDEAKNYYIRFFWPVQDKNEYTGVAVSKDSFVGNDGKKLCSGYPDC